MHLLHLTSSMNPNQGGVSQGIRNTVAALQQLGVTNEVVSIDDPDAGFLAADSLAIHPLGPARGPWFYSNGLIPWLEHNVPRFDAVIVNGLWLYHSFAANRVLQTIRKRSGRAKPRLYVMPHGMLDPWFQRAKGRRLKAARNWLYWLLLERNVVNGADGLLFTCEQELRLARTTFPGYEPQAESDVGFGIAPPPDYASRMTQAFNDACPGVSEEPYLLFLSRIDVKKGVDLLIAAYTALKQEGCLLPKLVVAGPGAETTYGRQMRTLADKDADVLFPGMLTGDAKWGAFYGCEAFVLPSHQENFGIAVVEALACGKPVLISDQVNIWREIDSGGAGTVGKDTPSGVKRQLAEWARLPDAEKEKMADKSKGVFERKFTVESAARRLLDVLEDGQSHA